MSTIADGRGLADADIRPALRSRVLSAPDCESDTAIIEELGVCRGQVRIDMTIVNGELHGYEIKSQRDTLRRLATQAEVYSRVLDHATLVIDGKHIAAALGIVPTWWGILRFECATGGPRFKMVRRGRKNLTRDPRSLAELLWLEDAIALLDSHNAGRGVKGKPRRVVWDRVCETISLEEIALVVRERLKARAMLSTHAPRS